MREICAQQWDTWLHPGSTVSEQDPQRAFAAAKPHKTAGADSLVSEQWAEAPRADSRLVAVIALDLSKRLAHFDTHAMSAQAASSQPACMRASFACTPWSWDHGGTLEPRFEKNN